MIKKRKWNSPIEMMLREGIVSAAKRQCVALSDYSLIGGEFEAVGMNEKIELIDTPDFHDDNGDWIDPSEKYGVDGSETSEYWSLYGQVRVSSYKVDLLLEMRHSYLAIECDGHEYHERTKQQATYDRSRDRDLLRLGIRTVRFTGSEIHHSIDRCVSDIYDIARIASNEATAPYVKYHSGIQEGQRRSVGLAAHLWHRIGSIGADGPDLAPGRPSRLDGVLAGLL